VRAAPGVARLLNPNLVAPIQKGSFAGYPGDTGLDIAATHAPVYAIAAGTLEYSENGHTRWTNRNQGDTPGSVRLRLNVPIPWRNHTITHVYYTHMSKLALAKAEGDSQHVQVEAGAELGISGMARGMPHLHIGLLLDNNVEQATWDSLLTEGEIRQVFGGYRNGQRLPAPLP
jgi:murein DD-endopeptidase MepM/ murein hydrolase activator NlpD